jgi:hypothetical protein
MNTYTITKEQIIRELDELSPEGLRDLHQYLEFLRHKRWERNREPAVESAYPTRFVSAERLDALTGVVNIGGDALADSEALYDADSPFSVCLSEIQGRQEQARL